MHMTNVQGSVPTVFSNKALTSDPVLSEIIDTVASEFGITVQEMMMSSRNHVVWKPRMVSMYFARLLTTTPLITLGEIFGGRRHTTVLRAYRRCRAMIERDEVWSLKMIGCLPPWSKTPYCHVYRSRDIALAPICLG